MDPISILLVNLFYPEKHPTIGFPVNVESLIGDLEAEFGSGVDVQLLDMQQPGVTVQTVLEAARARRFDVVGISVKTGQRELAESIFDGLLGFPDPARPRVLLVGGYRPRVFHEEFAERYPEVLTCIGEGEPTMRALVHHLRGEIPLEEVPNLVYRGADGLTRTVRRQHDLRSWHPPATSSLPFVLEAGGVVYLETSRGCSWGKCTFCSRKFSSGTKPSTVPVDRVAQTWATFHRQGVRHIYCSDEDFLMNSHEHGRALGEALLATGVDLEFWVQTTVDGILGLGRASFSADGGPGVASKRDDEPAVPRPPGTTTAKETLSTLKRAGLTRIFYGLESGSASQLLRYRKGVTAEEGAQAVQLCREVGLDVEVGVIALDPLTELSELRDTVRYVRENDLAGSAVKILNLMCVQKGVAMYAKTKQAGLLSGERDIDTFLYPYEFAHARVGEIAQRVQQWNRHGLSEFTYALRRLVDADPSIPVSARFLLEIRHLEFDYLARLSEAPQGEDEAIFQDCMQRRFEIMRRCMDAVAAGRMQDPNGFLQIAFEDSRAWMSESDTADVMRL